VLDAYLARIGVPAAQAARPDLDALAAILWGHVRSIPFENLDILLGEPIRIDLPSVIAKLVERRRGGYCFEQNTLLAAALGEVGFAVTPLAARVRWMATAPTARTHMLLAVEVPGRGRYLADAGFGGNCPTLPIPLAAGAEVAMHLDRYRLIDHELGLMLQVALPDGWADLYAFTLEPQLAVDYEVANHFTSTHPSSHFTKAPTVAITTDDGRITLRGSEVARRRGAEIARETITDPDRLLEVLAAELRLVFPPGTRFRGGPG
jgi:N-hydroxyarylamine O-acetyltransferase